ncbi:MAG: DUF6272 family protein [Flavobacteriales bacterium]|jgi:hypothetical protein
MSSVFPSDSASSRFEASANEGISENNGIISEFQWSGPVHDSSTRFIVHWLEDRLGQLNAGMLQRKRIIHIAIELLQNLHHHAAEPVEGTTFKIEECTRGIWRLRTQNRISEHDALVLQDRWEQLKKLETADLRLAQRDQVAQEERSSHGGGGIGLNDILRKADGLAEMHISKKEQNLFVTFTAELPINP